MGLSLALYLTAAPEKNFDRPGLETLVALLAEKGLIPAEVRGSVAKGGRFTVRSVDELREQARAVKDGRLVRLASASEEFKGTIDVYEGNCSIDLYFDDELARRRADSLLSDAGEALRSFAADGDAAWRVRRSSGLSIRNFAYPRPRPARTLHVVDAAMLIDVVDERAHTSADEKKAVKTLREAKLPKGVRRTVSGPRIVLEWAADVTLADEEGLRERLAERERWLAQHLEGTLDPNWNEAGDIRSGFIGGQPHPPLTLYSPPLGVGYKAIHGAMPAAEIDEALQQAAGWISSGKVDEQTPVSDVIIIADSRKAAVALHPRMVKAGVRHVIYPDEDGTMWDPFPEGSWIETD